VVTAGFQENQLIYKMGILTKTYVIFVVAFITTWLSIGIVEPGLFDSYSSHVVEWVWKYHGKGCGVCLEDQTFVRGGVTCRIILPKFLRRDKNDEYK